MRIYMAALHSNGYRHTNRYLKLNDHEKVIVDNLPWLLESYHYIHKQSFVDAIRERGDKVFLDSGAFSAYTLGVTLSVEAYCDYIKKNSDIIARDDDGTMIASVLDGIGDPLATYRNQLEMEARGVRPLPCFHSNEDPRYLDWYVANYEYITLGGLVGATADQLMVWLDRMWENHLIDGSGRPKLKVHGFGITSIPLMERYPWYSCDSSSWIQTAAFGSILTPEHGQFSVSTKSPSRHDKGQHITTLSKPEREYVEQMLQKQGFSVERLATVYESRAAYNLWAYRVIEEFINEKETGKFIPDRQELFPSTDSEFFANPICEDCGAMATGQWEDGALVCGGCMMLRDATWAGEPELGDYDSTDIPF